MNNIKLILHMIILFSILFSQETGKLALLPINVIGQDSTVSESITELTQNAVIKHSKSIFVERLQIEGLLYEQMLKDAGLIKESEKFVQMTTAQKVILGSLTKLGEKSFFILRLIEVKTGQILKLEKSSGEYKIEDYYDWLIEPTVKRLFEKEIDNWSVIIKSVSGINGDTYSYSDSWVQLVHNEKVIGRTKVVKESNNPIFNERINLVDYMPGDKITFKIYENDFTRKQLLGKVEIDSLYTGMFPFEVQNQKVLILVKGSSKNPEQVIVVDEEPENFDGQLNIEIHSK